MELKETFLIGIAGRAGAGKTTFAEKLKTELFCVGKIWDSPIKIIGLADFLKSAVCQLYGISLEKLNTSKQDPLGRFILEKVGQEFFPAGFHVDKLDGLISISKPTLYIIHDVRMIHEVEYIHKKKGVVIRLYRPGEVEQRAPHSTEVHMNKLSYDLFLHNDHGLQHLQFLARDTANQILCTYLNQLLISKTADTLKSA